VTDWHLECSACDHTGSGDALASVCPRCGQPLLVRYDSPWPSREAIVPRWDLWRYRAVLPIRDDERPVSLGEGVTPLLESPALAREVGVSRLWVKDEGRNPTASFKARGMSAAVTRAAALGVAGLVVPTAGNAGAALAAYGAAAGLPVRVFAPASTPEPILAMIRAFGAVLDLVDGHIGDAGKLARAFAAEQGYFDVSTLREPYRIEGKKTMGLELAEQLGWRLPDVILYPTGGGTGLIGMWKAFAELKELGWIKGDRLPRLISCQAEGCAPMVRAFEKGERFAELFPNARTVASGLRVPVAVADFLMLDAIRESGGKAVAGSEAAIGPWMRRASAAEGISVCPETAVCFDVLEKLIAAGEVGADEEVVVFNTGAATKYLEALPVELPTLDKDAIDWARIANG